MEGFKGIHKIDQLVNNVMQLDNILLMKELEPRSIIPYVIAYLCSSGCSYECKMLICKRALPL